MKALVRVSALMLLLAASAQAAITTSDLSKVKPEDLTNLLAGAGITITNVKFTGANAGAGTFVGGNSGGLGVDTGVILSSGDIANVVGPNDQSGAGSSLGTAGDADLDKLIAPNTTKDATILEFDFVAQSPNFSIRYVFASEEYKEYVNSAYNDVFGFFLDGQNIAYVAGAGTQLVSVNSINHESNFQYYIDNPTLEGPYDTQFDGFTVVLTAFATVTPGSTHHIKLAIADTTDSILDSAVLLQAGGISGAAAITLVPEPYESVVELGVPTTFKVRGFGLPEDVRFALSASGLPEGSTVTFSPSYMKRGEVDVVDVTVEMAPTAFPRRYPIELKGAPDDEDVAEARGSAMISVACAPPIILALHQPASQTVVPGAQATIKAIPTGSGPFSYQWYEGPRGSTWFPIAGATSDTLVTPPVRTSRSFWVRIGNGCGTADSATARISTTSSRDTRPTRP